MRHHGELLGAITVTKPAGEPLTPPEDELLGHVASQAGLVLRNVRLIDDLRSSAERLVTSQDGERRRLERNLHDGAQQSLVSVALLLRMALARVGDDPDGIAPSMTEASAQLQQAIDELRELARGIHPAILTERGLGPAVTSLAERSRRAGAASTSPCRSRPPATVEGTLYFVVAEALTNVAKYAQAQPGPVTVEQDGDMVGGRGHRRRRRRRRSRPRFGAAGPGRPGRCRRRHPRRVQPTRRGHPDHLPGARAPPPARQRWSPCS